MLRLCRSSAGYGAAETSEVVLSVCLGTDGRQAGWSGMGGEERMSRKGSRRVTLLKLTLDR